MALGVADIPKRGYLAQINTVPPLIYPFQYNPTKLVDTRDLSWAKRGVTQLSSNPSPLTQVAEVATEALEGVGMSLSGSELKYFKDADNRTIEFSFVIDGRERRPGEPARRRNDDGDILGDLAVLRSFVYPELANLKGVLSAATGGGPVAGRLRRLAKAEPPSAVLVFGSTSIDGFITQLKITETQFNSKLDPVQAEVSIEMMEKIDSLTFLMDSIKRVGRTTYHTAYEDIGDVLF